MLDDEILPGRTEAERKRLAPLVRRVDAAKRKLVPTGVKVETQLRRALRSTEELIAANAALQAEAERLADERRQLLPAGATDIEVTPNEHWHDDRRYAVSCRSGDAVISLGGCVDLGDALARRAWFEAEIAPAVKR